MKVLLFIFMASIGPGSSSPSVEAIAMPSIQACNSAVSQLKDAKKPGRGYTDYEYVCVEASY